MNTRVEIVYFMGCPNALKVIEAMKAGGISFDIVIQDRLSKDDIRRSMSSPSVLVNGAQIIGSSSSPSCTFGDFSTEGVLHSVRSALTEGKI